MNRVIAIVSGGLDSTVLLHHLRSGGSDVLALSINYGQRHRKELQYASRTCKAMGIQHQLIDLSAIKPLLANSGSSLVTDAEVAHGHYESATMKTTVVPNRNMIMLSVAVSWAISEKAIAIAYAAHAGDHAIYPDCRREFTDALEKAIKLCDWHVVELWRPFVSLTKADIVNRGHELEVDFVSTWSCYEGGDVHCGKCGTCVERKEAFRVAGIADPTCYK